MTRVADLGSAVREIEHTADLGLEVEAPSLPALFERAGLGMLALMADVTAVHPHETRPFDVTATDRDELLHDWLQAILIAVHAHRFVPCELTVESLGDHAVQGLARGERLDPTRHRFHTEIKGVTWHQLAVRETPRGWWTRVIFDV